MAKARDALEGIYWEVEAPGFEPGPLGDLRGAPVCRPTVSTAAPDACAVLRAPSIFGDWHAHSSALYTA